MIKFFRKIRKQLLRENKFTRYLIYAIGEIILVVIGILIALYINNWNQQQKRGNEEIVILKEISENLEADLIDFNNNYTHFQNTKIASSNLIKAVESNINYNDSLAFHLYFSGMVPYLSVNLSGYKLLESKGIELISNDSLRQYITGLYDVWYPRILSSERDNRAYVSANLHKLRNKYLSTISVFKESQPSSLGVNPMFNAKLSSGSIRKIINYEEFKKDTELLSMIKDAASRSELEYNWHLLTETAIKDLINQIDKEIQNKH